MTIKVKNLAAFNQALKNFGDKTVPTRYVNLQKRIARDLLSKIVRRTPVDTGTARGGWHVSRGGPQQKPSEPDKNGRRTISRGRAVINQLKFGNNIAIYNNVFYVQFLENGYSRQAPNGMMALSIAEVEAKYARSR